MDYYRIHVTSYTNLLTVTVVYFANVQRTYYRYLCLVYSSWGIPCDERDPWVAEEARWSHPMCGPMQQRI